MTYEQLIAIALVLGAIISFFNFAIWSRTVGLNITLKVFFLLCGLGQSFVAFLFIATTFYKDILA